MARWIGMLLVALAASFLLSGVNAQDTKKGKLDAEAIFKKLDANNDGKLSKIEFLKLADNFKNRDKAREKLTAAFEKFDTDKMGLTQDQFRKYLDSVNKKDETPPATNK
jgi:Ca2+-binding EF-hand superfamily protein